MATRKLPLRRPVVGAFLSLGAVAAVAAAACKTPPPETPPAPSATPIASAPPPLPTSRTPHEVDQLPGPSQASDWAPPTPDVYTLKNGMKVWFVEQGATPLVSVELVFKHGSAADPSTRPGTTSLMADLLDEGAGKKSALELNDAWQRLATDYGVSLGVDSLTFSLDLVAEKLEPSLELLSDVVRRPKLAKDDFERIQKRRLDKALNYESQPGYGRRMALRRSLFGSGYLADLPNGTQATLEKVSLWNVKSQYRAFIQPDAAEFIVVGKIDKAAVTAALEKTFGDWRGKARVRSAKLEKPASPAIIMVDYAGASQSALALARRTDKVDTDEFYPAMVFNRSFGGFFTSRVNMNLREDKGYTYGASSQFNRFRDGGYFFIAADVKSDTTRASIDEVYKELKAVCGDKPITPVERAQAVSGLLLGLPNRFEKASSVAYYLSELPVYGREADWYAQWSDRVEAVTREGAQKVAKEYCDPAAFSIIIAGDKAKVEPTLKGLKLPYKVMDRAGKVVEERDQP